jgi:hypothetical protein
MFNPSEWQQIGTAVGSCVGAIAALRGVWTLPYVQQTLGLLKEKALLVRRHDELVAELHSERSDYREAIGNLKVVVDILREELDVVKLRLNRVESELIAIKPKYSAAIGFIKTMISLNSKVLSRAQTAGADVSDLPLPPIPENIKEDLK